MPFAFERHVLVCTQEKPEKAPQCAAEGGRILDLLRAEAAKAGLHDRVLVGSCGCLGLCEKGPHVIVHPEGRWYAGVAPADVPMIVHEHLAGGRALQGRSDPEPGTIRAEVAAHRAKVMKMKEAAARSGALPEELNAQIRGYQQSRVILTAVELDLFTHVGDGGDAAAIAGRARTDPRATEALLNALAALGLLEKAAGRFTCAATAAAFLRAGAPHDSRAALMHTVNQWNRWATMTQVVRTGEPVGFAEMGARDDSWTAPFIAAMHKNGSSRAPAVIAALAADGPARRILDVGGGSGAYSIAFAKAWPDAEATVFDLATVTPLTRRYAEQAGVGPRVRTVDGDMRADRLGEGFDLALLSAICHMHDPGANRALLKRVFDALAPGGRVVIQDSVMNDDKTRPASGALFALNMLVSTERGSSYSEAEYGTWLAAAGFAGVRKITLPGPSDLMVATKPR